MRLSQEVGPIHFIGIGGIGMSGIAEVMHNLGFTVQGSDLSQNANVDRLRALGLAITIGHDAENIDNASVIVTSSAVKSDNPEVVAARARFLPVVRRAEMLAELMRLKSSVAVGGTHGKTTTTSMIAAMFDAANMDPTVINGGIINAYGTNARLGEGEWMVVEADESDGTFVKLPAEIAIVTNIDPEHLDHYGDFDALRAAFYDFVVNVPFYGFAVMCIDHPEVQALIGRIEDRRIVTYGESPQAEVRMVDLRFENGDCLYDVVITDRMSDTAREITGLRLPMPGRHNALNSLAAVAVAEQLKFSDDVIRSALANFAGVKRRFTKTGVWNDVVIFDDYGHHPVEIAAVLSATRDVARNRVIAVMQPHRYTRLESLFDDFCSCFNDADVVIIAPVYEAGEQPIEGFDRDSLVEGLTARGHRQALALPEPAALAGMIAEIAEPGDVVVCLGAGTITYWAHALPQELAALEQEQ